MQNRETVIKHTTFDEFVPEHVTIQGLALLIVPSDPPSLRFFFPLFLFPLFFLMNDALQHNSCGQYQRHCTQSQP